MGKRNSIQLELTPMNTVHIDHLGPFPKFKKGNMIDAFTKYARLLNTKTSLTIVCLEEIAQYFGYPKILVSDRRVVKKFDNYCKLLVYSTFKMLS